MRAMVQARMAVFARVVVAALVAMAVLSGLCGVAFAAPESSASASGDSHQSIVYANDEPEAASDQDGADGGVLALGMTSNWAIVDLVCALGSLVLCIVLLGSTARKRVEGDVPRVRAVLGGVSAVFAFVGMLLLAMTQNFAMPAAIADELSLLFVVLSAVQVILFVVATKHRAS